MNKYTVWITSKALQGQTHVNVYDAASAADAIQQALKKVSTEWERDPEQLSILGIVEGDIRLVR